MAPVLESDGEEEVSTLHGRHGEALPYSVPTRGRLGEGVLGP